MQNYISASVKTMLGIKLAALIAVIGIEPWVGAFFAFYGAFIIGTLVFVREAGKKSLLIDLVIEHICCLGLTMLVFDAFIATFAVVAYVIIFVLPLHSLDIFMCRRKAISGPAEREQIYAYQEPAKKIPVIYDAEVVDD